MTLVQIAIHVVLVVVPIIYFFVKYRYSYWWRQGILFEEPVFPYGNFKDVGKTVHINTALQRVYERMKDKAPFTGIYVFLSPVAIPTNLDLIKNILIKDFNYFTDRGLYYNERDEPLSAHLFLLDGLKWKSMRNKLSPTFSSGKMKIMFPTIVAVAEKFQEVLANAISTQPEAEIWDLLARFTTDVIGTSAFGIDCNSLKDPNTEFRVQGKKVFAEKRNSQLAEMIFTSFPKFAQFFGIKQFPDTVNDFFFRVVKETVTYRETNNVHRNDFIDLLIGLKNDSKELTLEQIAAQAFLFFVGGYETSSTTMSFCLYELAIHQDIQEKLREEVKSVLENHDSKLTYDAMSELKYMEQVVNETLRIHSPVGHLIRKTLNNYPIPNNFRKIEKGTMVLIPVHAIHMDPEIHLDPEIFDPERFSPENIKKMHPCAFLPFGAGPRNCVGLRFGKMQVYIGLATLLQNFKFSTCAKTKIPIELNVKNPLTGVKDGIILKVEKI